MNTKNLLAALSLVASIGFVSPAAAVAMSTDVQSEIDSATNRFSSQIHVTVDNNTVILSGAANPHDHRAAEQAALRSPGVEHVINQISVFQK